MSNYETTFGSTDPKAAAKEWHQKTWHEFHKRCCTDVEIERVGEEFGDRFADALVSVCSLCDAPKEVIALPHEFQLSGYNCVWQEGPSQEIAEGGFVAVRPQGSFDVADWYESDVYAHSFAKAIDLARDLIADREDTTKD